MTANRGATYRTLLIALAALIALPFVMWGGLTWQTGRALQAELNKVKASGAPLTMAQVAPPPVPDNQNAALLYIKAFRYLRPGTALGQTYRDLAREENPARRRQLLAKLRPLLAANRRALTIAAQGARLPASRLPVDWAKLDPLTSTAVFIKYTGRFRQLARLFAAQAEVESADGRVEDAVQSCLIGVRMGDHVSREPDLIVNLTGRAMQAIALRALTRVLKEHRVSPALCAAAFRQLGVIDVRSPFHRVLQAQRVEGLATLDYFQRSRHFDKDYADVGVAAMVGATIGADLSGEETTESGSTPPRLLIRLYPSPLGLPLRRGERVYYFRLMDRFIMLSQRPYREVHSQLDDIAADADYPPRGYLLMPLVFVPTQAVATREIAQVRIDGVRIILALKAYQAERGAYPESLAALRTYPAGASAAPEGRRSRIQGWDLPRDPFSGKDFVYHRIVAQRAIPERRIAPHKGAGFILYSWGEDLKDDGGNATSDDGSPLDIVWTFGE